jgi:hypothetical protein
MSTRSNIGYQDPNTGLFHYIYAHWDGYISHNGKILRDHYKTLAKVKMLVNLGAISSLKKNVRPPKNPRQEKHVFNVETNKGRWITVPVEKHTFDTPDRNTVVAYIRDRGDNREDNKPVVSKMFPLEQDWAYCFIDNKWYFKNLTNRKWREIPTGDLAAFQESLH